MTTTNKGEEKTASKIAGREDSIPIPIPPILSVMITGRKKRKPKNIANPKEIMIVKGISNVKGFPELLLG